MSGEEHAANDQTLPQVKGIGSNDMVEQSKTLEELIGCKGIAQDDSGVAQCGKERDLKVDERSIEVDIGVMQVE
ncbi:hypothetical protein PIB30_001211 [Stylosanthes scabra]|uniref:Uncharacterized protein n=1 Tax=Stylosanthes scabra TaxID=79078 RepID=A0ABU6W1B2_9FABA|nr:hypothetical protein [Stylosanthes scabra]